MARLKPEDRKQEILEAAVRLARVDGYSNITRDNIATAAGVSMGLVNHHYGTINQLKRAVMRAAISREILSIIAEGIVLKDKVALKVSEELRKRALNG
jgi:AcrR family transcriptional regulator